MTVRNAFLVEWLVIALVWLIGAVRAKPAVRHQSLSSMLIQRVPLLIGYLLLLRPAVLGPLDVRLIPDRLPFAIAGLALNTAGLAFAAWARWTIGGNWSATVTVKREHQLIRSGPYRLVRHPIYSGLLLAFAGTGFGLGLLPCLLALPLAFVAFWPKLRLEEQFMSAQFGTEYAEYRRETKALIPGLL
jgi:protein-S-isoprenylcysteine O-methyltransferase Ste14